MTVQAEFCKSPLQQQLARQTDEDPRDGGINEVGRPVALGEVLRMRLVVERVGLGFVGCLIF